MSFIISRRLNIDEVSMPGLPGLSGDTKGTEYIFQSRT
jgi:hypothetical protein